jgi:dTDP-glucose 4,6-dehydratase
MDAIRGERIFVTGATGFIGSWLLESLAYANDCLAASIEIVVLTRNPAFFAERLPHLASRNDIQLLRGDVRTFDQPAGRFGYVIHGATDSRASVQQADRRDLVGTIVDGTSRVIRMAEMAAARHVLFLSSGAVYGPQPEGLERIPETYLGGPDPTSNAASYAEAKRMAEHLCTLASSPTMGIRLARIFALVGPRLPLDGHFAVGNFLRDAASRRTIEVQGDGTPHRSYLHAADLTVWLLKILVSGTPGRPYNVGSPYGMSLSDVAGAIARLAGMPGNVHIAREPTAGPPHRYVPDVTRAREELGLDVWLGLEQSLVRSLDWVRTSL